MGVGAGAGPSKPMGDPIGAEQAQALLAMQRQRWIMRHGPGGRSPTRGAKWKEKDSRERMRSRTWRGVALSFMKLREVCYEYEMI